ncbi:MAG TPA: c-type cytochrome [Daejeonella sp.]|nr:c-type cytochrome [Daejeonella sp.]
MYPIKKTLLTLCSLSLFVFVAATLPNQKDDEPQNFKAKNLKVLPKNISHKELDKIMDGFKDALGVKCNHCHVSRTDDPKKLDFVSDAKPEKEMARKMLRMTEHINKKYFRGTEAGTETAMLQVQCKTCHRGMAKPELK